MGGISTNGTGSLGAASGETGAAGILPQKETNVWGVFGTRRHPYPSHPPIPGMTGVPMYDPTMLSAAPSGPASPDGSAPSPTSGPFSGPPDAGSTGKPVPSSPRISQGPAVPLSPSPNPVPSMPRVGGGMPTPSAGFGALAGLHGGDDTADQVKRVQTLRAKAPGGQAPLPRPAAPKPMPGSAGPNRFRKAPGALKPIPQPAPAAAQPQAPRAPQPPAPQQPSPRPAFSREAWRVIEGDAAGLLRRGDYGDYMDFGRDALSRDFAAAKPELEAVRDVMARTSPDRAKAFDTEIQQAFRDLDPTNPTTASARAEARLDRGGNDGAVVSGRTSEAEDGAVVGKDADRGGTNALPAEPPGGGNGDAAKDRIEIETSSPSEDRLVHRDPQTGVLTARDPDTGAVMTDAFGRPATINPGGTTRIEAADLKAQKEANALVGDLLERLDGETPMDAETKAGLIEMIDARHKHDPGTRIALTEVVTAADKPGAHAELREILAKETDTLRDPATQVRSREIEAFTSRIDQAYPGGLDGYIQDRAEARHADLEGKTRLVNLTRQWQALEDSGSNDPASRERRDKLETRIKHSIGQSLKRSAKARAFIEPPHGDHDWVLAQRFSKAEDVMANQRNIKEALGPTALALATAPLTGGVGVVGTAAATGYGAVVAGADASRARIEKSLEAANVDFKDPIAVKDFVRNHEATFQQADADAMQAFVANLAGAGAGKFVGELVNPHLGKIGREVIGFGVAESFGRALSPK